MEVEKRFFAHPLSDVSEKAVIGDNTSIWQFCVVLENTFIGSNCNICSHCFIENNSKIGDRVTVKNSVNIWDGIEIEDDCFIGPSVIFTNDKYPISKRVNRTETKYLKTLIKSNSSIGAGSIILPGLTIGENSLIAAGSIVTKSIPPNSIFLNGNISKKE